MYCVVNLHIKTVCRICTSYYHMRTLQFYVSIDPLYVRKPIQWLKESYVQAIMPLFWQELGNIHFSLEGFCSVEQNSRNKVGQSKGWWTSREFPCLGMKFLLKRVEETKAKQRKIPKNTNTMQIRYKYKAMYKHINSDNGMVFTSIKMMDELRVPLVGGALLFGRGSRRYGAPDRRSSCSFKLYFCWSEPSLWFLLFSKS